MIRLKFTIYGFGLPKYEFMADIHANEYQDKVYALRSWCRSNTRPDLGFQLVVSYGTQIHTWYYRDEVGGFGA